jgi:uncharacterized protein (TIRG00374 family)
MKSLLGSPKARVTIGLLIGIGLLFLVSRFIDIPVTIHILQQNLATPLGLLLAILSGIAFLSAFSIRGIRWKLFLNPIGNVSTITAIRLFFISIFINFLLPISGGEIAKTLMLKRIASIPISRSLPTVAMDRSMDLMPALFIMVIVPFLGIHMDIKLWLVLGAVAGLLIGLMLFAGLAVWKRDAAITLLSKITAMLPRTYSNKITAFATGFVDSLLTAVRRPKIFIPAMLLTCVAVIFDSLFALFAFRTIGYPISFGTAIFGYTIYNMFFIFPTPPGQLGSNEVVGMLVFAGLLRLSPNKIIAMFLFSHSWAALLMCTAGITSLKALGLTIPTAIHGQAEESEEVLLPKKEETPALYL